MTKLPFVRPYCDVTAQTAVAFIPFQTIHPSQPPPTQQNPQIVLQLTTKAKQPLKTQLMGPINSDTHAQAKNAPVYQKYSIHRADITKTFGARNPDKKNATWKGWRATGRRTVKNTYPRWS